MDRLNYDEGTGNAFFKSIGRSIGLPNMRMHPGWNHFDFTEPGRRILVVGPMGSGKTEFSARIWRDSRIALQKKDAVARTTRTGGADRRQVFFVRSRLDEHRFPDYPSDALAYRGGYECLGRNIITIQNSFDLERVIAAHPQVGTWVIDEASFYDERIVYVVLEQSERRGLVFVFPTLISNFRRDVFNQTARLLLESCTDIIPLTAYCEHEQCLAHSINTYRYYDVGDSQCPALYFDPLIIIGGDRKKHSPLEPNYCTRCDEHHYLPGKEYAFLTLKPLGAEAARGNLEPLRSELRAVRDDIENSLLYQSFVDKFAAHAECDVYMNALRVPCIAEKMLIYLFDEQNLLRTDDAHRLVDDLALNVDYVVARLADNGRPWSSSFQ